MAALFTRAKTWKQSKCPLRDELLEKLRYIYNEILFGHTREDHLNIYDKWMDFEGIMLSEISRRKTNID